MWHDGGSDSVARRPQEAKGKMQSPQNWRRQAKLGGVVREKESNFRERRVGRRDARCTRTTDERLERKIFLVNSQRVDGETQDSPATEEEPWVMG